jgi:hypothetical protein
MPPTLAEAVAAVPHLTLTLSAPNRGRRGDAGAALPGASDRGLRTCGTGAPYPGTRPVTALAREE